MDGSTQPQTTNCWSHFWWIPFCANSAIKYQNFFEALQHSTSRFSFLILTAALESFGMFCIG